MQQLKSIFRFLGKPVAATVIGTETEFRGEVRSKHEIQIDGAVIVVSRRANPVL